MKERSKELLKNCASRSMLGALTLQLFREIFIDNGGTVRWFGAVVVGLLPTTTSLAGSIQSFDVPGAATTCGSAISGKGLVSAYATGGSLAAQEPFLYDSATGGFHFPKPALPAGLILYRGVTLDRTILVADEFQQNGIGTSYALRHGALTPLSGLRALATGINDNEDVFGTDGDLNTGEYGFILTKDGKETKFSDGSGLFEPEGIDASGRRMVGTSGNGGFFVQDGVFRVIQVPGAAYTLPMAVDRQSRISGTYFVGTGNTHAVHGFLLRNGAYQSWDVPGAAATGINGANEGGQIVGCYRDTTGIVHGFVATP